MIRVKVHDHHGVRFGWLGNDLRNLLCYFVVTEIGKSKINEIVPYQFITTIYTEERE